MDDRDIDRLLAGSSSGDDVALAQLAEVLTAVGDAYPTPSTEGLEASHLAAMIETAHLVALSGEPAPGPGSNAHVPALRALGLPTYWRTTLSNIWTRKGAKVAAITFAAVLALGGTAYAGVLPAPVQKVVASAAQSVGVTLPSPTDVVKDATEPGETETNLPSDDPSGITGVRGGSHAASATVVPGNNGLHLGWQVGKHLGWGNGQNLNEATGTVPPGQRKPVQSIDPVQTPSASAQRIVPNNGSAKKGGPQGGRGNSGSAMGHNR